MPITLYQFPRSNVPPIVDARLYDMLSGGAVGIVQGCEITHLGGNQLQVSSGWGICKGRVFQVQQEVINATVSTNGLVSGRALITIDISNGEEPAKLETQAKSELPDLIQENINLDGTIYQIDMAEYSIDELAITNLKIVFPKADFSGVNLYIHTKTGTVHEYTGQGANGRAIMTADVSEGDTFSVNGISVTAYMGTDEAAGSMAGSPYTGRWVTFVYDSEAGTLNFKGGGGKKITPATVTLDTSQTSYTIPKGQHDGTGKVQITLEEKSVTQNPVAAQVITPSAGKVLSKVTVNKGTSGVQQSKVETGDFTGNTYSYNIPAGSVWVMAVLSIGGGSSAGASSSINTPNCTTIFDLTANVTANSSAANRPLKIRCFRANQDTTISHSASAGSDWAGRYYGLARII